MEDNSDDKDDTKRRTRNISEKKRRDTFNMLVNELSSMVTTNNRKMDKSTVLRSTISFLKKHNEVTVKSRVHDVQEDWKPSFLSNEEFTYLVLEALEGFIMVFSVNGQIIYVSESISSLLGYNPADLINKSIFDLTFEDDRPNLYSLLQNPGTAIDPSQPFVRENEIRFQCHIRRSTLDFKDEVTYDLIEFNGHFRTNTEHNEADDICGYRHDNDTRLLFVCTGRLYTPQLIRDVSLVDANRNEFTSRHSLEWKFLFLDHRAPPIIGYLPFEVLGTSGYDYYHFDDLEKVVTCHEELMQKGELTSCYYRFLTKGQQWIWLQTRYYITYHQWNAKPEFVVCTHTVVSEWYRRSGRPRRTYIDQISDVIKKGDVKSARNRRACMRRCMVVDEAREVCQDRTKWKSIGINNLCPSGLRAYTDVEKSTKQEQTETEMTNDVEVNQDNVKTTPEIVIIPPIPSPTYISEHRDAFVGSYTLSQSGSVKSASAASTNGTATTLCTTTAATACSRAHPRYLGSDNSSLSGESRISQRNTTRELKLIRGQFYGACHGNMVMLPQTQGPKGPETSLTPQYGIGAQYLEPAPYVGALSVPGVLPMSLPHLPVLVSSDQSQMQEQLQRKHEELQQMIIRQQEELRQVKEQLLLARLGILQPLINVPNTYINDEDREQNQRVPAQIEYDNSQARALTEYIPPQPPSSTDHNPREMPQ